MSDAGLQASDEVEEVLLDLWRFLGECEDAMGETIWYSHNDTAIEGFIDLVAQYRPELAAVMASAIRK